MSSGLLLTSVVPGLTGIHVPLGSTGQYLVSNGSGAEFGSTVPGSAPSGNAYEVISLNSAGSSLEANATRSVIASTNGGFGTFTATDACVASSSITSDMSITGTRNFVGAVEDACDISGDNCAILATGRTGGGIPTISGTNCAIISCEATGANVMSCNSGAIISSKISPDTQLIGTRNFMASCDVGGGITGTNSVIMASDGICNSTHNNNMIVCSTSRSSTADNTLEADFITSGGVSVTSDASVKVYVEDNNLETQSNLCEKLCNVKCKKYRLKGFGREMCGFDADEMMEQFPQAVKKSFFRNHFVTRKTKDNPWVGEGDFTQEEVESSSEEPLSGIYYREIPCTVKSIDLMSLNNILWAVCKQQTSDIEALKQKVGL